MRGIEWARDVAESLLAGPLPRRWEHSRGVGRRGEMIAPILGGDAELLAMAAWLHDIGYAPDLAGTGFHPLDGARYLRDVHGADETLCRLVAHHTCAVLDAAEKGLLDVLLAEFPMTRPDLVEALTFCDMTTSPDGVPISVGERITEIRVRHDIPEGGGDTLTEATPYILAAVRDVGDRLASADVRLACPA
ncbi:HD domain-containing protein [Spongiactinospora sp. TRM90649]|uniref:HD domain-containing protein n=1 Tax=Spongiactinospora sp. TRM90649 TaxID=3031114 RepID=UPI0023F979AC|nr:HD domain-containing protein [Spongiactinospora sp. TRM90649]MDF5751689.1 HD domain-containing protein [Spongiactinospora sp. TRM90649]